MKVWGYIRWGIDFSFLPNTFSQRTLTSLREQSEMWSMILRGSWITFRKRKLLNVRVIWPKEEAYSEKWENLGEAAIFWINASFEKSLLNSANFW